MSIETPYFSLGGGLNLVSPAITIPPGAALEAMNYEPDVDGGYRRIDGYERHDGRARPSDATYYLLDVTLTGTVAANDVIAGAASAASAEVIQVNAGELVITALSGNFQAGETLNVAGSPVGTADDIERERNASDPYVDADYLHLAAGAYRAKIGKPPGSGPVRGVWVYNGNLYAFRDNAGATACVMHKATAGGWVVVTTPALVAGGRYEFVNHNFYGSSGTFRMYGCDGKNKAFQYDGTTFTQITTGMTTDTPAYIAAHKKHLFLAFTGGSLQHSPLGDPTGTWTPVTGAGELAMGDEITGILNQPGDVLAVFTRSKTYALYGSSSADWSLSLISAEAGCVGYTAQNLGSAYALDDRGIVAIAASQSYGNFAHATISQQIQPLINQKRGKAVTSSVVRERNQYRVYFNDGTGLVAGFQGHKSLGITQIDYGRVVRCICSAEDALGAEVVYFGSDDGYVYQAERGTSFDGAPIEAWLRLPFNHFKRPRQLKQFRKLVLELAAEATATVSLSPDLSYGDPNTPSPRTQTIDMVGLGGFFDTDNWDEFIFDGQTVAQAEIALFGIGYNQGLLIYSHSARDRACTLQGVIIHYTPRRLAR